MRVASRVALGMSLVALAAACTSEAGAPATTEVLDSAGVRIVINPEDAPVRVSLDAGPVLTLPGSSEGNVTLFRVEGGVLAPGEEFVLANAGNHEVLYFAADGTFRRRVGREGDGPGEFRTMSWMEARTDGGVVISDSRVRRITALGPTGTLLWSRRFTPGFDETLLPSGAITAAGTVLSALDDGRVIGYPRAFALPDGNRGPLPLQGDLALYPSDSLASHAPDPIGRRTIFEWYEDPGRDGFPVASIFQGPRIWWGGHSGRFALTESSAPRIEVFNDGRLTLVVRERRARAPFSPDSIPSPHAVAADSLPAYHDLRVDGLHRLWARLSLDDDPAVWRVFDASGVAVADVLLPRDARVLDADGERLMLLRRDALDLERVTIQQVALPGHGRR